jgi:hypothetical protein
MLALMMMMMIVTKWSKGVGAVSEKLNQIVFEHTE